jgi:hypothetical protein
MKHNPTQLRTLGDLYQRYGHCYCGHAQVMNIDVPIDRFGADHEFIIDKRIVRARWCSECGRLAGQITPQPR